MKKIFSILSVGLFAGVFQSQSFIQAYKDRADQVTQTNISNLLLEFSNLGIKTTGSIENTNALNWLKTKYQTMDILQLRLQKILLRIMEAELQ